VEGYGTGKEVDADAGTYGWIRRKEERAYICCVRKEET